MTSGWTSKLVCGALATLFVLAAALPQSHGAQDAPPADAAYNQAPDCCSDDTTQPCNPVTPTELHTQGCCPQPDQPEDCPCKCPCCGGKLLPTINLLSLPVLSRPVFSDSLQRVVVSPDTSPTSLSLGVDVQPPIA